MGQIVCIQLEVLAQLAPGPFPIVESIAWMAEM